MDEATKQQVMIAVLVGSLTATIYQIVFNSGLIIGTFSVPKLILCPVIGVVVGGATYGVLKVMNK